MGDVNWDNVSQPQQTEQEPEGSNVVGTIIFIVLLVVGVLAGGAYVNSVMIGERVRDVAVNQCPDPTCVVDVRTKHPDCFSANVSYGAPGGLADFQTGPGSPKLGIATVDIAGYTTCVMPAKPKTLAEEAP